MESEVIAACYVEPLPVPRHIPGPIDGNPYALVDRKLFRSKKMNQTKKKEVPSSLHNYSPADVSRGINDLDNLLNQLGSLSKSCKNDMAETMKRDENCNLEISPNIILQTRVTTKLPTINVVSSESSSANGIRSTDINVPELNTTDTTDSAGKVVTEIRVKPRLPARTSSFGAVSRHQKGNYERTFSEDRGKQPMQSSNYSCLKIDRNLSTESDEVFDSDNALSPTVSEMLNELSSSPLLTENQQNHWQGKKSHNYSGRYENWNENSVSESNYNEVDAAGEFRQGRVKDHVKQFNRIVTSPDPTKVSTGVPMPGLVQGVNYEDKISKFNYRSLAPGQRGPALDKIYIAGSPPKTVVYENEAEQQTLPILETEDLFIPSYADQSAEFYLRQREQLQQQRGMKTNDGHIPFADSGDEGQGSTSSMSLKNGEFCGHGEADNNLDDQRSDSAYGESTKSLSTVSASVGKTFDAAQTPCPEIENLKSSSEAKEQSHEEDSSGYARIEDIRNMKKKISPPGIVESGTDSVQDQEVIAVSHVAAVESFPDRLNKKLPEIKSNKDLSLAVYQTNYLPGFTNGQPTVMCNSQINIDDSECIHREDCVSESVPFNGHISTQIDSHERSKNVSCESSTGGLGPGVHLVESPPSPCHSAKSDSSSTTHSPSRKTLRHRMKRSNSSTSSLSSSELFPEVSRHHHVKFDRDTLSFWYKPAITRDEAITLLKDKAPGTFVVRDSQSYGGAFGLAVKVVTPPLGVIQQAGGDIAKINMENELIRHFLIEPCKQGVRLKGSNSEPAFPSLVALIYQHSVTKMALPIELVLPTEDIQNIDEIDGKCTLTEQQVLQNGAACNLVYLSSINVEGLSGDGAVKYAISKVLSTNQMAVKPTIVKIKVDQGGITLTDMDRKLFFRKHYVVKDVLHCVLDPRGRRFNLNNVVSDASHQAPCFGVVVAKPEKPLEHECIVLAELEPSQPASAVIDFVQRVLKNGRK